MIITMCNVEYGKQIDKRGCRTNINYHLAQLPGFSSSLFLGADMMWNSYKYVGFEV